MIKSSRIVPGIEHKMCGIIFYFLWTLSFTVVAAVPSNSQRIVGGTLTNIEEYPYVVSLLYSWDTTNFFQSCGGIILHNRAVLSAAHCFRRDPTYRWRIRVGSTMANSGGVVHVLTSITIHPHFVSSTLDNDIAILRSMSIFTFSGSVKAATISSATYNLRDNEIVWAVGWGATSYKGPGSEHLRHVQVWTVNQATCRSRYAEIGNIITDNMLCSGWLDVGGRDQCQGDSGGPLIHKNIIVGVSSWGRECAHPRYPGVNARVSHFTTWIIANS